MIKTIKSTWQINVRVPTVPNFLFEDVDVDNGNEGKYPLSDFSDDVLQQIGKIWTQNLLDRAAEMRLVRKKP